MNIHSVLRIGRSFRLLQSNDVFLVEVQWNFRFARTISPIIFPAVGDHESESVQTYGH